MKKLTTLIFTILSISSFCYSQNLVFSENGISFYVQTTLVGGGQVNSYGDKVYLWDVTLTLKNNNNVPAFVGEASAQYPIQCSGPNSGTTINCDNLNLELGWFNVEIGAGGVRTIRSCWILKCNYLVPEWSVRQYYLKTPKAQTFYKAVQPSQPKSTTSVQNGISPLSQQLLATQKREEEIKQKKLERERLELIEKNRLLENERKVAEEKKKAYDDALLRQKQDIAQRQKADADKAEANRLERQRQFEIQQKAAQKIKEDKEAVDKLLSQSQSLMLQNKYAEAEEALLRARQLDPTNIHVKANQDNIDARKEWESKYLQNNSSFGNQTPSFGSSSQLPIAEGNSTGAVLLNTFNQGLNLWMSGKAEREKNEGLRMLKDAEDRERKRVQEAERRLAEEKRQEERAEAEKKRIEREKFLAEIARKAKQERDTFLAELPKNSLQGLPDSLSADKYGFFILQDPKDAIYSTRPFVIRSNFREYYATSDELSVFLRPYLKNQAKRIIFQGPFDDYEIALRKLSFLKAYYPNLGNEQTFIDPIIYKNKKSENNSFWGSSTKDSNKPIPTTSEDFWGKKNN